MTKDFRNIKQTQFDRGQVLKGSFSELLSGLRSVNVSNILKDGFTHISQTLNENNLPSRVEYYQASTPTEDDIIFTADIASNLIGSYLLIKSPISNKTYLLYTRVSGVGEQPLIEADSYYAVDILANDPASLVKRAYANVVDTLDDIQIIENKTLTNNLSIRYLNFGPTDNISGTFSVNRLQEGDEVLVGEIDLDYTSDGFPIWNGTTLTYHSFNVFNASFEVNTDIKPLIEDLQLDIKTAETTSPIGYIIGSFVVTGGLSPYVYAIEEDVDDKFSINGTDLTLKNNVDSSVSNTHDVRVKVTDANGATFSRTFTICVREDAITNDLSLSLNGTNQYMQIPNTGNVGGGTNFSWNIWIKRDLTKTTGQMLIDSVDGSGRGIQLRATPYNNGLVAKVSDGTNTTTKIYENLDHNNGLWHNIIYSFNQGQLDIYYDGVLITPVTSTVTAVNSVITSVTNIHIGQQQDSTLQFKGFIDNVYRVDKSLTEKEALLLYNEGVVADLQNTCEVKDNLTFLYDFLSTDQGLIPTVVDSQGNIDALVINSPIFSADVPTSVLPFNLYSLTFDGISENLITQDTSATLCPQSISISLWAYIPSTASFPLTLIDKNGSYLIRTNNVGDIRILIEDGPSIVRKDYRYSGSSVFDSWMHLVITFSNNTLKYYVNAAEQSVTSSPTNDNFNNIRQTSNDFTIGVEQGSSRYFEGSMDEVSIYNKALSQAEINELYNAGSPLDLTTYSAVSNQIAWWRMGDLITGTVDPDQTGTKDLTLVNMDVSNKGTNLP